MNWMQLVQLALQIIPTFLPKGTPASVVPIAASVAGAIAAYDHDTVKWVQGELNALEPTIGNATVNGTPLFPLTVDGVWGGRTTAAANLAETHFGLPPQGTLGKGLIIALQGLTKLIPAT